MYSKTIVAILFYFLSIIGYSQQKKGISKIKPSKVGFIYGFGSQENFLLKNLNYVYETNVYKASFQYVVSKGNYWVELQIQPQVHFLKHQLLNENFVDNKEELEYLTDLKSMNLYALQFELQLKHRIVKRIDGYVFGSIGPAIINKETERLAKGFTFIENLGIGITYQIYKKLYFDIKSSINHVSNGNLQKPNGGYNAINMEIGLTLGL